MGKSKKRVPHILYRKKLKSGTISVIMSYNIWTYHRERKK